MNLIDVQKLGGVKIESCVNSRDSYVIIEPSNVGTKAFAWREYNCGSKGLLREAKPDVRFACLVNIFKFYEPSIKLGV